MKNGSSEDLWRRVLSLRPFVNETVSLVFIVIGVWLLNRLPVSWPHAAVFLAYLDNIPPAAAAAFLISWLVHLWKKRRQRETPAWSARLEAVILARIAVVLSITLSVQFLLKSFIYLINPRTWDLQLSALDRILFLGADPGRFFTALFGAPFLLHFFDLVYSPGYLFLVVGYTIVLLALLPPKEKLTFAAAYEFLWIAGAALYILVPAWGPVYVFTEKFRRTLAHMPLTVMVQGELFRELSSLVSHPLAPRTVHLGCVASFPSLHVGEVTLLTLASRRISRSWFRVNVVILILIVIGSVLTGYHYLVDGEMGFLLAAAFWVLACRIYDVPAFSQAPNR